ncbi:hypothetical protein ACFQ1M_05485 [Sungkyunkwania multivorans]|uniref:Adhesin domain-containing protein n=1 Tax=Sungkyunkwania multivorans TaxID=1173618 RepID=A0ABW3CYE2_9FLAO
MKTILYRTVCILLMIPSMMMANHDKWKGKYTKEKKIKKEFNVNADALLKLNNSYGNLYLTSWDQNKVVIEVHVKTNGNNEEKVQKKLDEIDVQFEGSSQMVYAKTIFNKNKKSSWWKWSDSNSVHMEINYTVKVPITNNVDLNNDYGSISLDRLQGRADISCDYGKIDIGELLANDNKLSFDYTSGSSISYMKNGKINADYSGFTLEKAENLVISADYTNSKIGQAKSLTYSCDYGNITIDEIDNLKGSGDYITTRIGKVHGNVDISSDYGSIKIEEMASDAGNVDIRSDYTGIRIGYATDYYFDFEVRLDYAGFKGKDDLQFKIKRVDGSDKYYTGYHGRENSGNRMTITADYGSITLNKN